MKELPGILALAEGVERTALLVAWVQSLFAAGTEPVLVGGAAVELYTGGAYTTGDLDLVGDVPPNVASRLEEAGFTRRGRHWIHEEGEVFLEFPSGTLAEGEESVRLEAAGCEVLAIAPEDLVAERLGAWEHWRSAVDGVNAWRLLRALGGKLDRDRVRERCAAFKAEAALGALLAFEQEWSSEQPDEEEVLEWARRGV